MAFKVPPKMARIGPLGARPFFDLFEGQISKLKGRKWGKVPVAMVVIGRFIYSRVG